MAGKLQWVLAFSLLAGAAQARTQQLMQGWDTFGGMLDYTNSNVTWSVGSTGDFKATYTLVGAEPSFVYQVGLHFYCKTNPGMFGRFPTGDTCNTITRQGCSGHRHRGRIRRGAHRRQRQWQFYGRCRNRRRRNLPRGIRCARRCRLQSDRRWQRLQRYLPVARTLRHRDDDRRPMTVSSAAQ